mgnify:CR=1 FL=1
MTFVNYCLETKDRSIGITLSLYRSFSCNNENWPLQQVHIKTNENNDILNHKNGYEYTFGAYLEVGYH